MRHGGFSTPPAVAQVLRRAFQVIEPLEMRVLFSGSLIVLDQPQNQIQDNRQLRAQRTAVAESNANYWRPRAGNFAIDRGAGKTPSYIAALEYTAFALDETLIRPTLNSAPIEFSKQDFADSNIIALPRPDGTIQKFAFAESSIMDPGLAAQFPNIKTYAGTAIDDPSAHVRFDITPLGFHAQVIAPGATYYIDPFYHLDQSVYASYWRSDMRPTDGDSAQFLDVDHYLAAPAISSAAPIAAAVTSGSQLRTYRTAIAATGEYTAFFGGTVIGAQSAIVTAINRVSGIFENELSIRLTLVANNASLVYTDPSADPYNNYDAIGMLSQNQGIVDAIIGDDNYDIGHVFGTANSGAAYIGVVGHAGYKAAATSGRSAPVGDAFHVNFVAHEMGHQFGADHTFNSSAPFHRVAATAYEPGSGSTIMGYAGITGANSDLQFGPDPYFHWISQQQILNYVDGPISFIGTRTNTGNAVPTVSAGADFTIPARTPFALTGSATDANSDALTYAWEQADLGPAGLLDSPDNGSSPLFRSFTPGNSPTRMFPKLSTVLSGATTDNFGERLPTTTRALKFRLTVRDNRAGGGAINTDDVQLNVINTGSAFSVTTANTAGTTWAINSSQTVTWNVAGTAANGINTANVKISLSTDGGATFPTVLAASTPNDGSHAITVPSSLATSNTARIKIEAIGNVFFDISDANLSLNPAGLPDLVIGAGQTVELAASQSFNAITVLAGATLNIKAGTNSVIRTKTLTLAGQGAAYTGTLNLHDNDLVIDYTGNSSPYAAVLDMLKKGTLPLGGNGSGLLSTEVNTQAPAGTMLAIIDNAVAVGQARLSGVTMPLSSILVKYTWRGDANLDGTINGSDYALADTGFSGGGSGWFYGDVNYDSVVNGSDFALIDTGFSSQTGVL